MSSFALYMVLSAVLIGLVIQGVLVVERSVRLVRVACADIFHQRAEVIFRPRNYAAVVCVIALAPIIGYLSIATDRYGRRVLVGRLAAAAMPTVAARFDMCEEHAQMVMAWIEDWIEGNWRGVHFSS